MKVLLCVPTYKYPATMPLSFSDLGAGWGYLSATLKAGGHEVVGLNPNNLMGYPSAKIMLADVLARKIRETKPGLIGLGGLAADYAFLRDAIAICRGADPAIPILLGGQIVTNDMDFIFDDLLPDYAIAGEADDAIVELCNILDKGDRLARFKAKAVPPVVDKLPFPDFEPFGVQDMLDKHSGDTRLLYRYSRTNPRPFSIVASRGCPFNCDFCVHGRRDIPYRARPMASIMAEIGETWEKYGYNILIVLDELFAVNKARMREFCAGIMAGKKAHGWDFDWMFQTHASARLDLETLLDAKAAGCYFFAYGLESASPVVLKAMNKRIKVEQVVEAMDLARQAKIGFGGNLIFGDPAETEETWAESLAFWLRHCQDNFVFLAMMSPYPGSKVFEICQEKGFFKDKRRYYERVDSGLVNMTAIPDDRFGELAKVTMGLERGWLFPKRAKSDIRHNGDWWDVKVTCPYCGEMVEYREKIGGSELFMGTGCVRCHRRIHIRSK